MHRLLGVRRAPAAAVAVVATTVLLHAVGVTAGPVGAPPLPAASAAAAVASPTPLPEAYDVYNVWRPEIPTGVMLFHPMGVVVDARGNVVVAEAGNGRLTRASPRGTEPDSPDPNRPPRRIGSQGGGPGQFRAPEDVAVSSAVDRIYVADTGNRRIQVLGLDGSSLAVWQDVGLPRGIAVAPAPAGAAGPPGDRVYASDAEGGLVRVLAGDGSRLGSWSVAAPGSIPADGPRPEPLGLSVAPSGDLVVADHANQRIVWLDADGSEGTPGAVVGILAVDNRDGPGGAPTDVGVAGNGDVFVAVSRGILRFRQAGASGSGSTGQATGVAAGLVYAETWSVYRNELPDWCAQRGCATPNCQALVVEERASHEGVQRLDIRPRSGMYVTYASDLRWPDRVVAYPALPDGAISPPVYAEGWVWPLLCRDYSEAEYRHATDMERVDSGPDPYYGLGVDTAGYLRVHRADGQWYGGMRAMQALRATDVAIDPASRLVGILEGDYLHVLDPECLIRGFAPADCLGTPVTVLAANQMVRRDRTGECQRALALPWRPGAEGPCIPDDRWWNTAVGLAGPMASVLDTGLRRLIVRTAAGGQLAAQTSLGALRDPFRAFVDLDYDATGRLWVLAADGAVRLFDEHGRSLGEMTLVGPAAGRSASLAVAPDGTFFVLTGDERVVKYRPEVAPPPTPTATLDPTPGPSPRPTRVPPFPTATPRPTLPARAVPLAEWSAEDLAGPGRYRDLAVGDDGRVMVPDAAGDRVVLFGPGDPAPTPTGSPEPGVGPCQFLPDKVADPDRLPLGDTTEVTLRLEGTCGSQHAAKDVVVAVDTSCQMAGERFARTRDALAALVGAMTVPADRMALVTFDQNQGGARMVLPFTADRDVLTQAATSLTTTCLPDAECRQLDFDRLGYMRSYLYPYGCLTEGRISDGLRAGREALLGPAARPAAGKVLVLLSSSLFDSRQILATLSQDPKTFDPPFTPTEQALWNRDLPADLILPVTDRDQSRWEGWQLREAGVRVYTSGVGVDSYGAGHPPDEGLLAALAWPADGYRPAAAPADLVGVFATEGREISARVLFDSLVVTDRVPVNMQLVAGSASPPAEVLPDGSRPDGLLRWTFQDVGLAGLPALSYRLEPLEAGRWPTNIEARAGYVDGLGYAGASTFPVPYVEVVGPTATLEPSPTAPRASPTASPSQVPSPTATATATATKPAVPEPIYLPFAYRWHCKPAPRPVDVALVMDTSSSMTGEKLDAARHAAGVFLGFLNLRPERDRACLVSFDNAARLVAGLTMDRGALSAGLAGLVPTPGTRMDLGMDQALQELLGPQARGEADRAIVILTDGLPMPGTEAGTLAQGDRARAAGVQTWAVGLGADVDPAFLAELAGTADRVLVAPAPSDLEQVYRQVASGIICR